MDVRIWICVDITSTPTCDTVYIGTAMVFVHILGISVLTYVLQVLEFSVPGTYIHRGMTVINIVCTL